MPCALCVLEGHHGMGKRGSTILKKSEFAHCMEADQEACHGWTDTYWLRRAGEKREVVVIRWGREWKQRVSTVASCFKVQRRCATLILVRFVCVHACVFLTFKPRALHSVQKPTPEL